MLLSSKAYILGLAASGLAAARFLRRHGVNSIVAFEKKPFSAKSLEIACKEGINLLPDTSDISFSENDLLIFSPGIALSHKLIQKAYSCGCEVMGEIELGLRYLPCRAVAISGTNGKTTVTMLIAHILQKQGIEAYAVGNVGAYGPPLTEAVLQVENKPKALLVVEMSSYQLEAAKTKAFEAAALLNITQDHLDRYKNMDAYAAAKGRLAQILKDKGKLFLQQSSLQNFPHLFKNTFYETFGWKTPSDFKADEQGVFFQGRPLYRWDHEKKITPSPFQAENELAALAICRALNVETSAFLKAVPSFAPPPHRCEKIARHNQVDYYDDSKGTNVDATIQAVNSFKGPIILIAGGADKESDFTLWRTVFKDKVKVVLTIGAAAKKIEEQLQGYVDILPCHTLEKAVQEASILALANETVLLSPGCASYDMFKDYAERGCYFQKCVASLATATYNESFTKN